MTARRLAAMLPCGVAACGEEDRTQTSYTPSNDGAFVSSDDTAAIPASATPPRPVPPDMDGARS